MMNHGKISTQKIAQNNIAARLLVDSHDLIHKTLGEAPNMILAQIGYHTHQWVYLGC
jgi:hypothetical protein